MIKERSDQWKDQYNKAMAIAKDLYEYALILDNKDEILEYQLAIIDLLNNCNVRIKDTWSFRINKLRGIMADKHFDEKLNNRIKYGIVRFRRYENKRLKNDNIQYFNRSLEFLG